MSIHLIIQAEDAEVEALLAFVCTRFPDLDISEQQAIMMRALTWMNAARDCSLSTEIANARFVGLDHADPSS